MNKGNQINYSIKRLSHHKRCFKQQHWKWNDNWVQLKLQQRKFRNRWKEKTKDNNINFLFKVASWSWLQVNEFSSIQSRRYKWTGDHHSNIWKQRQYLPCFRRPPQNFRTPSFSNFTGPRDDVFWDKFSTCKISIPQSLECQIYFTRECKT